jgi:hypothetical protein
VNIFRFIPGYETHIYEAGKEPLLLLLISFLVAFSLTRLYTRLARYRGWGSGRVGNVHLHHIVPGIVLVLVGGVLLAATSNSQSISRGLIAIVFGAGAALILDEFALVLHLEDVYWTERGRLSVEASIVGVLFAGVLLVASSPFGSPDDSTADRLIAIFTYLLFNVAFAVITLLKGKFMTGALAFFMVPVALVGALRLAKPYSPWAKRFYDPARARSPRRRLKRGRKLARATRRFESARLGRFERRVVDAIGGKFDATSPGQWASPPDPN